MNQSTKEPAVIEQPIAFLSHGSGGLVAFPPIDLDHCDVCDTETTCEGGYPCQRAPIPAEVES